jgi:hypothetical protein
VTVESNQGISDAHTMLPTTEDIISDFLTGVCLECGGPMGGCTKNVQVSRGMSNELTWRLGSLRQLHLNISALRTRTAVTFKMTPGSKRLTAFVNGERF